MTKLPIGLIATAAMMALVSCSSPAPTRNPKSTSSKLPSSTGASLNGDGSLPGTMPSNASAYVVTAIRDYVQTLGQIAGYELACGVNRDRVMMAVAKRISELNRFAAVGEDEMIKVAGTATVEMVSGHPSGRGLDCKTAGKGLAAIEIPFTLAPDRTQ